MRNKVAVLLVIAGLILCLSGCKPSEKKEVIDESALKNAKTVYDVSSLMTNSEEQQIYSECKNDKDIRFYFDLLGDEEYIKVTHKGKDYLLFWFNYYSYIDYVKKVISVDKTFRGEELRINAEVQKEKYEGEMIGCFPSGSRIRFILSLDQDVRLVYFMGKPFKEYNGGHVKISGKEAIVDKDLNFTVPPVYDGIYDLESFTERSCAKYYRVLKKGEGNGVLDNNYKPVLSNRYGNVYYINENKFIVCTSESDPKLEDVYIVDGKENIVKKLRGCINAEDTINLYTAKGHIQFYDPTYGNLWGLGIIDTDLNIIIEPVYQQIFWKDNHYEAEDYNGKITRFDINGKAS